MVHWDGLTIQTETITEAMKLPAEERKQLATRMAFKAGMEAFFVVGSAFTAASVYANFKIPAYKAYLGTSGKVLTPLVPATMAYALVSDQLNARMAAPERFAATYEEEKNRSRALPFYQRTANWFYENPTTGLAATGVPIVGGVFYYQSLDKFMTASQKVMHTRVIGQASVLALLVSTMFFRDQMDRRGGAFVSIADDVDDVRQNTDPVADANGNVA